MTLEQPVAGDVTTGTNASRALATRGGHPLAAMATTLRGVPDALAATVEGVPDAFAATVEGVPDALAATLQGVPDALAATVKGVPDALVSSAVPGREPERVGRYEIRGELGRGGMGVVYHAFDPELARPVAIKLVLDPMGAGPDAIARFTREARAAARVRHPAVVSVLETGVHEGRPFMVLQLVEGESLAARLKRGPLPPRDAAAVVARVARALQAAHAEGVLHRDVKPANVLLDRAGQAHLTDFGLAREADGDALTASGQILGTPSYMAPEQARGDRGAQDARTDVYGLGALLYAALTAHAPFEGRALQAVIASVISEEPPSLRRHVALVHADLETIALRCLSKDPGRRYASANEVALELERFLEGRPIVARPIGRTERLARWLARNKALAAALVLGTVALGASAHVPLARLLERRARSAAATRTVEAVLSTASEPDEAELARHVETLVRDAGPEAVPPLALHLESVARDLRAVTRDVYLSAARPLEEEAAAGAPEISGLEPAVDRWLALSPGETLDPQTDGTLRLAARRLVLRASRDPWTTIVVNAPSSADAVVAREQERRVGTPRLRLARVACEALRRLAVHERATEALGAYLLAELDGGRAERAAMALSELGGARELELVAAALGRFGRSLRFRFRVEKALARTRGEPVAPATPGQLAARAVLRHLRGDGPGALVDLDRALELEGRLPGARLQRARVRREVGDLEGALADVVAETAAVASTAAAWVERSQVDRARHDSAREREALDRALEFDSADVSALTLRANSRLAGHDFGGAIEDASRAIACDPGCALAWTLRGRARIYAHQRDEGFADLAAAIRIDPDEATVWHLRATARSDEGDLPQALADVSRALALEPRHLAGWTDRSEWRLKSGDAAGALEDATAALRLDPSSVAACVAVAGAKMELGEGRDAVSDLTRALERAPASRDLLIQRGRCHQGLGDLRAAIADLSSATAVDPGYHKSWYWLASFLAEGGDFQGARAAADRAIALEPENLEACVTRAWAGWELDHDAEHAYEELDRVIHRDPRRATAWKIRAHVALEANDGEGLVLAGEKFAEILPRAAEGWMWRGVGFDLKGDWPKARESIDRALEIDPRQTLLMMERARIREKLGELDGAVADFTRAIEMAPRDGAVPPSDLLDLVLDATLARAEVHALRGDRRSAEADFRSVLERAPRGDLHAKAQMGLDDLLEDQPEPRR